MDLIARQSTTALLREATRTPHAQLEKAMVERLRQTVTPAAYTSLLRMFYGFYKPVEDLIDLHVDKHYLPDHEGRRKSSAILSDLRILGEEDVGGLCSQLPIISNSYTAFGAMYVLEGSTLGGRIICAMLKKNLNAELPAFSFFEGYGENTGVMWAAFKSKLDNYTTDAGRKAEIIDAATTTFVNFKKWMNNNG